MSTKPFETTKDLLNFLDLPYHQFVEEFVDLNFDNSKDMTFNWRTKLNKEDILNVQSKCINPMKILGYNQMTNISRSSRNDDTFPIIVKHYKDLWSNDLR